MVGLDGFEPSASRLSGVRSNQTELQAPKHCQEDLPLLITCWLSLTSSIERTKLDLSKLDSDRVYLRNIFSFFKNCFLRKEVIQPLVPQRLPCYDFTPIISHTLGAYPPLRGWSNDFWYNQLSWCDGRCVQGPGTYSPWHADPRLLAIPASWSRVADSNPN
jgi:hypothetical protein